jgi:hypothetical protein
MSDDVIGLDLGQANDYTALIVVERSERPDDRVALYDVRHIDRTRGVPYPRVVDHARALIDALRASSTARPTLVVDYTGVGRPVADMLVVAQLDADLRLVTITGGDSETVGERGERRVPKRNLAGAVQVLLQSGRLRIGADLPLASMLTTELQNFKVKISLAGHDSYGAGADWREGNHDDLVLALALALWHAERLPRLHLAAPVAIGRGRDDGFRLDGPWAPDPWASIGET